MKKTTLILILVCAFCLGLALYFIVGTREPYRTAIQPFVAPFDGIADFVESKVSSFVTTLQSNPLALLTTGSVSAGLLVFTLANKAYNSAKSKIETLAQQKVDAAQDLAKDTAVKNQELQTKLTSLEATGDAVANFKTINEELQAKVNILQKEVDQLRTERDLAQNKIKEWEGQFILEKKIE